MTKTLISNVRGPKGEKGDNGDASPEMIAAAEARANTVAQTLIPPAVKSEVDARGIPAMVAAQVGAQVSPAALEAGRTAAVQALADQPSVTAAAAALAQNSAGLVVKGDQGVPTSGALLAPYDTWREVWLDSAGVVLGGIDPSGVVVNTTTRSTKADIDKLTAGTLSFAGVENTVQSIVGGYLAADISADGTIAENAIGPDGNVPQWVLERWRTRMGVATGSPDIHWAGDSMTAALVPAQRLSALSGRVVRANGVGGEPSQGIAFRTGALPLLMMPEGGSIPSSGPVNVTFTDFRGALSFWPLLRGNDSPFTYSGTLAGIQGVFSITTKVGASNEHNSGDIYSFTRSQPGSTKTVNRPTPFILDFAKQRNGDLLVIWAGRNNYLDPARVKADIRAMVKHAGTKKFIVVSVFNGDFGDERKGDAKYATMMQLNADLRDEYGFRYLDARTYMVLYGLADKGITPTATDSANVANDIPPASLRADALHLSGPGSEVVGEQVYNRFVALGDI